MENQNKFAASVELLSGSQCHIVMPRGADYSRASAKFGMQKEFDIVPFLMAELCIIEGEKHPYTFYIEMYCDDYMKIMEKIGQIVSVIR